MSAHPKPDLVGGLDHLIGIFAPFATGSEVVEISTEDLRTVIAQLRYLRHLAFLNERELGGFRTIEAARFASGLMERITTDPTGTLQFSENGKIIRPDFGRRT